MGKSKEELKKEYLPNFYSFDDGDLIINTGDKVAEEKVQRLYWASKEVAAQYFRSINSDEALEPGNPDDKLTIVIYNNPEEYKMNKELYGYNVNNGGMYIETTGTFFTYERTPDQSVFSLEELFRHEFTHYLEGRYVIPGFWGQTKMYEDERLTWYEEGQSEFFAGSSRTQGVLPRKSIIGNIVSAKSSERFNFKETIEAKYTSGFDFYNYTNVIMGFLYHEHFNIYTKFANYLMEDKVAEFDHLVNEIKENEELNKGFEDYMKKLIQCHDDAIVPLVADDYLEEHPFKEKSEIMDEIIEVSNIVDGSMECEKSDFFSTFTIKGKYIGNISQGKLEDIQSMNSVIDGFLEQLEEYNWSGYSTVTAYFVNHRVDEENNMVFDLVFHGLLPE